VRFADSVARLWEQPERVLLEIGPGSSCATLAKNSRRQDISARDQITIASMGSTVENDAEWNALLMAVGQLWLAGVECDGHAFLALEKCRRIPLPGYPFERKRYWLQPGGRAMADAGEFSDEEPDVGDAALSDLSPRERVIVKIGQVLEDTSGEDLSGVNEDLSFMEMGFDSLFLTQASLAISREFGVKISFRQLMEDFNTIGLLADHLEAAMPVEQAGSNKPAVPKISTEPFAPEPEKKKVFGAGARIAVSESGDLTAKQQKGLNQFIQKYTQRTRQSKSKTQANRPRLADPRVVSGFRPLLKEIVYPIMVDESHGVTLRDIDGNEYVDLTCGFGSNFFGFSAPFIVKAVEEQLHKGYEIGPQHPLTGEVAGLVSELTGLERVAFCNTGSEAVLGAMRLARTVTGRDTVVMFAGDYHGILDEVIVRGTSSLRSLPAAPGIPRSAVENVLVLDYGTDESLRVLRERSDEFAAIMVEPVQSRRPGWQPKKFLQECRRIADECGAAFIMDEVITGFRIHPRGAQAIFEVKADIATYGKVIGGGMPIGVIAGSRRFMDALDGGQWQFGDESYPQVGVTYFAGTFVRHPLALAAAKASLTYLKEQGPQLQETLNRRTDELVAAVNTFCLAAGVSLQVKNFGSLFKIKFSEDEPFSDLFYAWMRFKGVHVWDARPCFLTIAHTEGDIEKILRCFKETVTEMVDAGLLNVAAARFETMDGRLMVPTTEAQKEIWTALLMDPDASKAYNESVSLRLFGALDRQALQDAIVRTVARHDALRSTFSEDGMHMRISPSIDFEVQFADLTGESKEARESRLKEILRSEADDSFDIENGPLLRARLLALQENEHLLVLTGHHLVCDGWSIDVIVHDLGRIYTALCAGKEPELEPPYSIANYARIETEWNEGEEFKAAAAFWLAQFEGDLPVLDLPLDHARPPMRTTNGSRIDASVNQQLVEQLRKISSERGCTFVNMLMAAFNVYLHQISGQEDIVVGLPTSGQAARGMDNLVGHCVNFLPIRSRVEDHMVFSDYMKNLRGIMLDAFEHQLYTFGTLVRNLKVARDPSRMPLAPVVFNVDSGIDLEKIKFANLKFEFTSNAKNYETFELFLNAVDDHGHFKTEWAFNTDLFDAETIQRHMAGYEELLAKIVEKPDALIGELAHTVV
ncbi:MAG: aminotransferase class III-fold pyridoxal phosphate-dependent enzyme, partial [Kiritimatiellales bacterium]|nr:aminotransferase class III-fold pyridoxal phosphate-dependent enzyme [Kiritimatiellales bacterium]